MRTPSIFEICNNYFNIARNAECIPNGNQDQKLDQDIGVPRLKKTPHQRRGVRIIDFDQNSDGLSVTFSQISRPRETGPS